MRNAERSRPVSVCRSAFADSGIQSMSCAAERIQFTVLYCGTEEKEPRFRIKAEKGRKKEYGKRETTEKKKTIQTETPVLCDYGDASADIVPAFV